MLSIDVERLALPTTVPADHKNGVSYIKAYIKALGINYYHHWRLDVPTIGTSVFRSISPFESLDVNPFQWDSNPKLVWPYCYIICSILDIYKNENLQNIRNYFGQSRFKILPDFFLSLSLSLSLSLYDECNKRDKVFHEWRRNEWIQLNDSFFGDCGYI